MIGWIPPWHITAIDPRRSHAPPCPDQNVVDLLPLGSAGEPVIGPHAAGIRVDRSEGIDEWDSPEQIPDRFGGLSRIEIAHYNDPIGWLSSGNSLREQLNAPLAGGRGFMIQMEIIDQY